MNQIVSCRLIFQLWKLPSPVRDGCIYCEYKWIIDVDIALLDSTTVDSDIVSRLNTPDGPLVLLPYPVVTVDMGQNLGA